VYSTFFGLKERPFQLVPNPVYLYLSRGHQEALAHLRYAVEHGDGFVEIIGEVGTGKTTLCRVFLENLHPRVKAAYIFNPKLNAIQLLKAINDEFGISSSADTTKELIDRLNQYLINRKAADNKVVIVIDEAQNLPKDVLEQLRLLSNLETTRSKLLQIVLVGQPELHKILNSHGLRQLNQRITLRCTLTPLTQVESQQYIFHRIHLAATHPLISFTPNALKKIWRHSHGIPRRINILCDRALLTAFTRDCHKITGKIVDLALKELSGQDNQFAFWSHKYRMMVIGILIGVILGVLGLFASGYVQRWITAVSISKQDNSPSGPVGDAEGVGTKRFTMPPSNRP
jgi:general secretion pathway protein A